MKNNLPFDLSQAIESNCVHGIVVLDVDRKIIYANSQFAKSFGYNLYEVLGIDFLDLLDDIPNFKRKEMYDDLWKTKISNGKFFKEESIHTRKDQSSFYCEIYIYPIIVENNIVGACAILQDITKRKSIEYKIETDRDSSDKVNVFFSNLLSNLPTPYYYKDMELKYVYCNPAFEKLVGKSFEELKGKTSLECLSPEIRNEIHQKDMEIIKTKTKQQYPIQINCPDGQTKHLLVSKCLIQDSNSNPMGIIGLITDLTEIEEAKKKHKWYEEKVKDTLESYEEFTYMSSHELKDPIRKIKLMIEMLGVELCEECKNDNIKRKMAEIAKMCERSQQLIEDMLGFAKSNYSFINLQEIDLNTCVDYVISLFKDTIKNKKIKIIKPDMPAIHGDSSMITQVFKNLLQNAIKYNENPIPEIEFTVEKKDDGQYIFGVKDNGSGIPKEFHSSIFEIFRKLDHKDGSGLGLHICKKIIQRHNGEIWVESKLEGGSHFKFTINNKEQNDAE